jgi:hypothetical protein
MRGRTLGLATLVAVLALSLAATPALAVSKRDKAQNKALKTLTKRTKATDKKLKTLGTNLGKLTSDVANAKSGLAAIQAAIPTVVSSLTTLGDAAKQLKTGLETAGAGLTQLSGAFQGYVKAAEYGVVQLYFDPEGDGFEPNDALPGQLLTSADVPDDANQSTVSGKLFFSIPDQTTAKPIALKGGMRSQEKDGTGAANPVGEAGLMAMTVSVIGAPGTVSAGGGNPGAPTTLPLTTKPNAAFGGAPIVAIPNKAPRSDATPNPFAFPDDKTIELTDPTTLQTLTAAPGRFTVTNTSGAPGVAIVEVTVRFNDLSASATDLEE